MKFLRIAAILTVAIAAIVGLQGTGLAQATNLRVTAPENGQKFGANIVEVRFELINRSVVASSSPAYQLQLDSETRVQTTSTEYTFTGLQPGPHTVAVEAVDANGTPIPRSANAVKFIVLPPSPAPKGTSMQMDVSQSGAQPDAAASSQPEPARADKDSLPEAGGALPLLSVIGFGVLLGGIASALKTR
jgi:uncharacterized protein (DUF2141 family)